MPDLVEGPVLRIGQRPIGHRHADTRGVQRGKIRDGGAESESEQDPEADGHG